MAEKDKKEEEAAPLEDPTAIFNAAIAQASQYDQSGTAVGAAPVSQAMANPPETLVAAEEAVDKANLADQKERKKAVKAGENCSPRARACIMALASTSARRRRSGTS